MTGALKTIVVITIKIFKLYLLYVYYPLDLHWPNMIAPNPVATDHLKYDPCHMSKNNILEGSPGGASGKEPACHCRRHKKCGFHPWVRKIPGEGHGNPIQCFCLENPMDRGAWWAIVRGVAKSWTHNWSNSACMHLHSGCPFQGLLPRDSHLNLVIFSYLTLNNWT